MNLNLTFHSSLIKKKLICLPLITPYVAKIWPILAAGAVNANPIAHNRDPPKATFRYENSFRSGPTNKPAKFIITSNVLMIIAAPAVPMCKLVSRSPKSNPNDGSMARVASY